MLKSKPVALIQPTTGWRTLALPELWAYRELLWILTWRDVKSRYRQMALGPLWIVIRPLISVVIFSLLFGRVANLPSDGLPYPIFIYTALLPWTFFAGGVGAATGSLLAATNLISKVYFPRLVLPISAILGSLVDLVISCLILLGFMIYYRLPVSPAVLFLPLYVLLALAFALAVGLWSAGLAVQFRDVQYVVNYGLQAWMYITPVVYSASLIPPNWQTLYQLNPMYWVVEGFRWSLLGTGQPPPPLILFPVCIVLSLLISGIFVFQRAERTIVDLL